MKVKATQPTLPGNYIDAFVKQMFSRLVVFVDFPTCYANLRCDRLRP